MNRARLLKPSLSGLVRQLADKRSLPQAAPRLIKPRFGGAFLFFLVRPSLLGNRLRHQRRDFFQRPDVIRDARLRGRGAVLGGVRA